VRRRAGQFRDMIPELCQRGLERVEPVSLDARARADGERPDRYRCD
jgi:hypothetical protein